jgi:hypothetical protein
MSKKNGSVFNTIKRYLEKINYSRLKYEWNELNEWR